MDKKHNVKCLTYTYTRKNLLIVKMYNDISGSLIQTDTNIPKAVKHISLCDIF